MAEASGISVPGYQNFELIGRGGFAVVYRAEQMAVGRTVAVKVLARPGLTDGDLEQFGRECRAMGELSWHPHIVVVHESGTTAEGQPYLAMEYLDRGSLDDRVTRAGALPTTEVLEIGVQLAGALETAHRADLLHRDLKPANVLVTVLGDVKLSDFGIAGALASTGTTMGASSLTVLHAAPEQLAGRRATVRSDVYGLASSLYALAAGRAAFAGPPEEGIAPAIMRVANEAPPDLRQIGVPEPLARVIHGSMAKDPEARLPSARALGEALQQAQTDLGQPVTPMRLREPEGDPLETIQLSPPTRGDPSETVLVRPPTPPPPPPPPPTEREPEPKRPRRVGAIVGALGAVVIVALLATGLVLAGGGGDSDGGEEAATTTAPGVADVETAPAAVPMEVTDEIEIDDGSQDMIAGGPGSGSLWVASGTTGTSSLTRFVFSSRSSTPLPVPIDLPSPAELLPDGVVEEFVWVGLESEGLLMGQVPADGDAATDLRIDAAADAAALGQGRLWVSRSTAIEAFDAATGEPVGGEIRLDVGSEGIVDLAVGADIWALTASNDGTSPSTIHRIQVDGTRQVTDSVPLDFRADKIEAVEGTNGDVVWIIAATASRGDNDGRMARLDPETAQPIDVIEVGSNVSDLAVDADGVAWATNGSLVTRQQAGEVYRVAPDDFEVTTVADLGEIREGGFNADQVATTADGSVWVTGLIEKLLVRIQPV